jgi:hypothetical protein
MGPYMAGLTITSRYVHSRVDWLQHIYYGQPYARVDLCPMPESTLSPSQELWIWPPNMCTKLYSAYMLPIFQQVGQPPPSQSIFKKRKTRNIPYFTYNFLTYACFMHVHYWCSCYSAYISNQQYIISNIFQEKIWISATLANVFPVPEKV